MTAESAAIEVIVMSAITSETKASGKIRKVTFLLANDGDHPFEGMVGDRLHIVPVRINDDESVATDQGEEEPVSRASSPAPRQAWPDMKPATQAALRCREPAFQRFLDVDSEEAAADRVRQYCGVESRSEIGSKQVSRVLWHGLDNDFLVATGKMAARR